VVLVLRQACAFVAPSLSGSVHYGTKGCLCDFNEYLGDVRYKVLNGFICRHCTDALGREAGAGVAGELLKVLGMGWIGTQKDPKSAATISSNLVLNLFMTRGLRPSAWESVVSVLHQEGVKQLLAAVGVALAAALLIVLGLKVTK
jgi:hypothetical protein